MMKNKENYSRMTESVLREIEAAGTCPSLLLHSCCAPCSSYVLEYLREYFYITVFYFNPNITPAEEYEKRREEELRLIEAYNRQVAEKSYGGMHSTGSAKPIRVMEAPYDASLFFEMAKGLETCPEGGERCFSCYRLRMEETARRAAAEGFDFFTTTLSISPLKNAPKINEIGAELERLYGVRFLRSDFKKRDGYKRSIELSHQFGLYRQNYCGCVFSERDAKARGSGENAPG